MRLVGTLLLLVLLPACDRSRSDRGEVEIKTVEVDAGPDAQLSTEFDEQATQVAKGMGGVLPSGFPTDLPIISPASVVDFGQRPGGGSYIELDSPVPVEETRGSLGRQLQLNGWIVGSIGEGGSTYSKGGRSVRLALIDLEPGTRLRYEY